MNAFSSDELGVRFEMFTVNSKLIRVNLIKNTLVNNDARDRNTFKFPSRNSNYNPTSCSRTTIPLRTSSPLLFSRPPFVSRSLNKNGPGHFFARAPSQLIKICRGRIILRCRR